MQEIAPGIFHWTAFHKGIGMRVSSYYVEPAGVVIDPMVPEDGLDVFEGHEPPRQALLTTRHHYRGCDEFAERFDGFAVACSSAGLHEFEGPIVRWRPSATVTRWRPGSWWWPRTGSRPTT
jgi:hypothetical protein